MPVLVAGCDKNQKDSVTASQQIPVPAAPPAATAPALGSPIQRDPVASFKSFTTKFVTYENSVYSSSFTTQAPVIDVKKTDSLINPVVGILTLSYRISDDRKGDDSQSGAVKDAKHSYSVKNTTFTFAIENDMWAAQSATASTTTYDYNGAAVNAELDNDTELGRLAQKASGDPMPDLETAKRDAENLQK